MKLLLVHNDDIRVIADSAIGRNAQPWFIPDGGEDWHWQTALAFRVSKLGKGIAAKFACRYIDAVTLLWVAEARQFCDLDFMDGAVVCGKWVSLSTDDEIPAELISKISQNATLKNGDIIAILNPDSPQPIVKNQHISISLNNSEVLSFNIK